jgi:hypothetical protein
LWSGVELWTWLNVLWSLHGNRGGRTKGACGRWNQEGQKEGMW